MWCEWLGVTTAKLTTVGVTITRTTQILGSENGSGGDDGMRAQYSRDIFEYRANTNACTGTGARYQHLQVVANLLPKLGI